MTVTYKTFAKSAEFKHFLDNVNSDVFQETLANSQQPQDILSLREIKERGPQLLTNLHFKPAKIELTTQPKLSVAKLWPSLFSKKTKPKNQPELSNENNKKPSKPST